LRAFIDHLSRGLRGQSGRASGNGNAFSCTTKSNTWSTRNQARRMCIPFWN
jgi:hypothetical protein